MNRVIELTYRAKLKKIALTLALEPDVISLAWPTTRKMYYFLQNKKSTIWVLFLLAFIDDYTRSTLPDLSARAET